MAMAKGNINQVSRDGWASLIDVIQNVILDQVNEWRNEAEMNPKAVREFAEYEQMVQHIPKDEGPIRDDYVKKLRKEEDRLKTRWVSHKSFPMFVKQKVPKTIHTKLQNNSWDVNYGYVTTDVEGEKMAEWWKTASAPPTSHHYIANERIRAKEAMRMLSDAMEERFYHTCQVEDPRIRCVMPNGKRTPDSSFKKHLYRPGAPSTVSKPPDQPGTFKHPSQDPQSSGEPAQPIQKSQESKLAQSTLVSQKQPQHVQQQQQQQVQQQHEAQQGDIEMEEEEDDIILVQES